MYATVSPDDVLKTPLLPIMTFGEILRGNLFVLGLITKEQWHRKTDTSFGSTLLSTPKIKFQYKLLH